MKEICHFVRGVHLKNRQKVIDEHMFSDSLLYLEREPENEHDANAIAVWLFRDDANHLMLGYVGRELACTLAPLLDSGHQCYVNDHEIIYNDDSLGLKIEIRVAESKSEKLPISDRLSSQVKVQAITLGVSLAVAGLFVWWLYGIIF